MSAPALYKYKTHTSTGRMFWASIHYLGRIRKTTERFDNREEAQAAARAIIANERALDYQLAAKKAGRA